MYEDALTFSLAGTEVYAYGLFLMLGCWLGMAALFCLTRGQERRRLGAGLMALLSLPLGFILARLMYGLLDPGFAPLLTMKNLLDVRAGGFAMYGALAGLVLAALAAARAGKASAAAMLDLAAPAFLAFLVPARLGEGYTALGISRPLTTQWLKDSFLARSDAYDAYLRTYLLEAVIALILFVALVRLLRRCRRDGLVFTAFCLLYGLTQTLMESLRYDGHLRYSFIGVQQVLSAALFSGALIALAVRALKGAPKRRRLGLMSLIALPLALPAIVGVEFLVDRSQLGKLFSYGLYVLVLALPLALGLLLIKEEEPLGKGEG